MDLPTDLQQQLSQILDQLTNQTKILAQQPKEPKQPEIDTVQLYVKEFLVEQPSNDVYITFGDFYRHYKHWCEINDYKPLA